MLINNLWVLPLFDFWEAHPSGTNSQTGTCTLTPTHTHTDTHQGLYLCMDAVHWWSAIFLRRSGIFSSHAPIQYFGDSLWGGRRGAVGAVFTGNPAAPYRFWWWLWYTLSKSNPFIVLGLFSLFCSTSAHMLCRKKISRLLYLYHCKQIHWKIRKVT